MSDINLQLVREFFELQQFHVLTAWRHENLPVDPGPLLFLRNSRVESSKTKPEFLLAPEELCRLDRALVEVRAWHAERFNPSLIEANAILGHVAGPEARAVAESVFGEEAFATILVISELPLSAEPRKKSLGLLRGLGIHHIIEFSSILRECLSRVSPYGNYPTSQSLQTLRLLKRYDFIRDQQLEFPFAGAAPPPLMPVPQDLEAPEIPDDDDL